MIQVSEIMTSMRFKLGDMQGAARSDFELVEAINQAIAFIYAAFGERHISAGLKTIFIEIGDDEPFVTLPSDFHNVENVTMVNPSPASCHERWQWYRIEGERFFGKPGVYKFTYYHLPQRVTDASDLLNIPNAVRLGLEGVALSLLLAQPVEAEAMTKRLCYALTAREIDGYAGTGPVQVWGDRV